MRKPGGNIQIMHIHSYPKCSALPPALVSAAIECTEGTDRNLRHIYSLPSSILLLVSLYG